MKYFYTLLFIALPLAIFAQTNYHEGYVVKNNGDTLKGFIDYHEWAQNPRSINFKKNKDDRNASDFNPKEIKEFQVNGETYVVYKGLVSMDKNQFPNLPLALDTSKKTDTIFLKQVVKGKYLALFYHQDFVKTRFFIAETNAHPIELGYSQYYDNATQLVVKALFRGQLLFYINKYMPGNQKLVQKGEDARFDQNDLAEIISAINGDNNSSKKETFFRFFVGGALNDFRSHFQSNRESIGVFTEVGPITEVDVYSETVSKFSTTISPQVNFGIDVFTNPDVQKFILRAEMALSYNHPQFAYLIYGGGTNNVIRTYSFEQYSATLTPQVIINLYNKNNFKIYLDGGVGLNFSAYRNGHLTEGSTSDLQPIWMNFPFQAGVVINRKLEFSLSYATRASLINNPTFNVNSQYTSIGLKYLFGAL